MNNILKSFEKLVLVVTAFFAVSCSSIVFDPAFDDNFSSELSIGDEIIYGKSFSLKDVYGSNIRAAQIAEEDLQTMVYFSVRPTTVDSLCKVNQVMGHLNPAELNKEITQAGNSESIIFNTKKIADKKNIGEYVNFGVRYYYIETLERANELSQILENFEVIEEYQAPNAEAEAYLEAPEYFPCDYEYEDGETTERSAWGLFTDRKICGGLYYELSGVKVPAYGVTLTCAGHTDVTDINGSFQLGKKKNIAGLCWIWANYENSSCELTGLLNLSVSTLVKVDWPSKLTDVTITASSTSANAKMAICSEINVRYDTEMARGKTLPKAKIWITDLGDTTSSAPCLKLMKNNGGLPDMLLTGANKYTASELGVVHHEYTHFVHNYFADNKDGFYDQIIASEVGTYWSYKVTSSVHNILETVEVSPSYDFSNPYVSFAENYAEWYSQIAFKEGHFYQFYKKSGNTKNPLAFSARYENVPLFKKVAKCGLDSSEIATIVESNKVVDFQEFYDALNATYPKLMNKIDAAYSANYVAYGNVISMGC